MAWQGAVIEIRRLEDLNAELLEALKLAYLHMLREDCSPSELYDKIKQAIAKAEG